MYEIREENGGYAVCKKGLFVKSFTTLKAARRYVEGQGYTYER
jgi:hypothetical protein